MATGEAAGAAAVHALGSQGRVHAVDVDSLRKDLSGSGVVVGGPDHGGGAPGAGI